MRVLIAYLSQTGNTEKVAAAICEEALQAHEAVVEKLEDIAAGDTAGYDVIFIGSPLHAGSMAEPVRSFLGTMQAGSAQQMAGFITHSAPAYPDQELDRISEPIKTACDKNNMEYKGCFSCQGFLSEALHEMIKKRQNLTDEQWAERVNQMTGHPDADDLGKARIFTRGVLS